MAVENTSPRVLDLSRPGAGVVVEIEASEAMELLVSVATLLGSEVDPDSYELGKARIDELRAAASPALLSLADETLAGSGIGAVQLLGLASETPRPRTADAFLAHLEATDPRELQLHLLGYYAEGHHASETGTMERAAAGDREAQRELLAASDDWGVKRDFGERLFELGPERAKQALLEILSRWRAEVFPPIAAAATPLAERDAAAKRTLAETLTPDRLVGRLATGLEYRPPPKMHRIACFPSYCSRPWIYTTEHRHTKIFCYPIAVDHAAADPGDPAELARVYKALADEGRLKLLKRLQAGPLTLADAAAEIGLAKSTAHHHLAILRQAGFVLIRDSDDLYSLRTDLRPEPGALLERYLGS